MFTTANDFARTAVATVGTLFFAGVCLVAAAAPAAAQPVAHTTTVSYSDLNLASASGRKALDSRIDRAAHNVCFNGGNDVASLVANDRCVAAAKAEAKEQVMPLMASASAN